MVAMALVVVVVVVVFVDSENDTARTHMYRQELLSRSFDSIYLLKSKLDTKP